MQESEENTLQNNSQDTTELKSELNSTEIVERESELDNTIVNQPNEPIMEVAHHHSSHGPKKLKDFIYEFFMLFLAVTAGFIVENIREHYVERHREFQYMESLVRDLKSDTAQIKLIINQYKTQRKGIDTLLQVLSSEKESNKNGKIYFYVFGYLNNATFFKCADRTISQLKSSGGLRLINSKTISDSISEYYYLNDGQDVTSKFCLEDFNKILQFEKENFDFTLVTKFRLRQLKIMDDKSFPTLNSQQIRTFFNSVFIYQSLLTDYTKVLHQLNIQAISLIGFLEKEYQLEKKHE